MSKAVIIKSKVKIINGKRSVKVGDKGQKYAYNPDGSGRIPVWFYRHRTPFYWYPIWMLKNEIEELPTNA